MPSVSKAALSFRQYPREKAPSHAGEYALISACLVVAMVMVLSIISGGIGGLLTATSPAAPSIETSPTGGDVLVPLVGAVGSVPLRAMPTSQVDDGAPVTFHLEIAVPQTPQLSDFLASLNDPSSPNYHQYLTLPQFYALFGPSLDQEDSLFSYLSGYDLTVTPTGGPLIVSVSGTAAQVNDAFHFSLYHYRMGSLTGIAPRGVPEVPSSLAPLIDSLSGLNGFDSPHVTLAHPTLPQIHLNALTPSVMRGFYNENSLLSAGDTGSATIGLAEVCDPGETDQGYQSDLNTFDSTYGLPALTLQFTGSGSSSCSGGQSGWDGETNLDIQWAHVIAPSAPILVCLDSSDPSVCDQTFVQNGIPFGSNSWGGGGPYHSVWQSAEAAGITLLASAGDSGAAVQYPAAEPDGLGIGGTSITPSGSSYGSESGWSGSGGGCDTSDAPPAWQSGMSGLSTVCGSTTQRGVPDVAMDADPNTGVNVVTLGQSQQVGGTSLSSPMWAAALDVIYQASGFSGFAAPTLYSLAKGSLYTTVFHDITTGNNGYAAGPGWDAVTGVGTPDIAELAAHFNPGSSPVFAGASASPTSGTAPLTVSFTGSASGGSSPYSYAWTFGDGGTSSSQSPSHSYASAGSYTATLTVTDSKGATSSSSLSISVSAATGPLSASASASPTSGTVPLAVSFTGSASGGKSPYSYSWAFGDGATSTSQSPSHTYTAAGSYTATLTVTDSVGSTAAASSSISVTSPPSSGCSTPTAVSMGSQVSGSVTPGGCALYSLVLSQTQWDNSYYLNAYETDGQVSGSQPVFTLYAGMSSPTLTPSNAQQSQAGPNAAMTISLATQSSGQYGGWGTYEFLVQASPGGSGIFCFVANLSNSQAGSSPSCSSGVSTPLSASASGSPTSGTAPLAVAFTGKATGGASPYTYSWAFGDGATSTSQNPSHTFSSAGSYTSVLTVQDSKGATVTSSVAITASASTGGSCSSPTAITFGTQVGGTVSAGGCLLYSITLTQTQWNSYYYVNAYETDGSISGTQPAFTLQAGMPPPALTGSNAKQSQAGPNAAMEIDLFTQASGQFGGWGTYEFLVQAASGDSGHFCLEVQLSNSAVGTSPACTQVASTGGSVGALHGAVSEETTSASPHLGPASAGWAPLASLLLIGAVLTGVPAHARGVPSRKLIGK